jgi:Uma2 family endonuclease
MTYLHPTLPSSFDLPCSDDTPVDNEEQNLLPNLLLMLLSHLWADRRDWYFGVDMAVYHTTGDDPKVPVVPDAFLSLGVQRKKGNEWRRSYVLWEEEGIVPTLAIEMVSHKPGGEYGKKMAIYAKLGVLYYAIYNPNFWQRDRHAPFEVYRLEAGRYELKTGEPFWMPEIGLALGRYEDVIGGFEREILTWYDAQGQRHLNAAEQESVKAARAAEAARVAEEKVAQAQAQAAQAEAQAQAQAAKAAQAEAQTQAQAAQAAQERARRQQLEEFMRSQGLDPDNLPKS